MAGPNASGKTNLLEAAVVAGQGSSFRAKDNDLITFNKTWARIDISLDNSTRTVKISRLDDHSEKQFIIDDKIYKRLNFESSLPLVIFEPNHLQLLSRGPEQRREYFDGLILKTQPEYRTLLNRYQRVLAQRNSLLKQPRKQAGDQLFVWNVRLAELGQHIATARESLVNKINQLLSFRYSSIAGLESQATVSYHSMFPVGQYATKMVSKLEKSIELDYIRGFTTSGPHREDYTFILNRHESSLSVSRGEARSLLLALKIIELNLVEEVRLAKPILLLDDVFSELDNTRRQLLLESIAGYQSLITTTDADLVKEYLAKNKYQLLRLGS